MRSVVAKIRRIGWAGVNIGLLLASALCAASANAAEPYILEGLLSQSWQEVCPCDSLDSIKNIAATTAGRATGTPRYFITNPTFPVDETDGTRSVHFQWIDGNFIKTVKVSLKVEDGALYAKLFGEKAMYVEKSNTFPYDFNTKSSSEYDFVYSDVASNGYNLQNFSVWLEGMPMPSGCYSSRGAGDRATLDWYGFALCGSFDSIVLPIAAITASGTQGGESQPATFSLFCDEGNGTRTAVFQWLDDRYIKAIKVAFKIENGVLFEKSLKAMYVDNSNAFPYDFNNRSYNNWNLATHAGSTGYAISDMNVRIGGLRITGEPDEYASATPGYGDYTNWTARVVSAPTTDEMSSAGVHAVCTGYDVYYSPDHGESWTNFVSGTATTTNDFDCVHVNGAVMPTKLVWRFKEIFPAILMLR